MSRKIPGILTVFLLLTAPAAHAVTDAELVALAKKITIAESSGNPLAKGDPILQRRFDAQTNKPVSVVVGYRARGLMQIQEGTWRRHTTESWSRAFEPALNFEIGMAELRRIVGVYQARGLEPPVAYVVWTYNTGSFVKHSLPKFNKQGKLHPWTWNHPNTIYRQIYRDFLS